MKAEISNWLKRKGLLLQGLRMADFIARNISSKGQDALSRTCRDVLKSGAAGGSVASGVRSSASRTTAGESGQAVTVEQARRITALEEENAALKRRVGALEHTVAELQAEQRGVINLLLKQTGQQ